MKPSIRTLDQIGTKTAVYLDADTIVRRTFGELWNLLSKFGAVPDICVDDSEFMVGFNAWILFFHPSTRIFKDMVSKLESTDFGLKDMEQSYSNHHFGAESVRLPYVYGGNLAIKERSPEMWKMMRSGMRIVHGTVGKTSTWKRSARTGCAIERWRMTSRNRKLGSNRPKRNGEGISLPS